MTMLDGFRRIDPKYVIMNVSVFIANPHVVNEPMIQIYKDPEWMVGRNKSSSK
jgi:hypothetical protein